VSATLNIDGVRGQVSASLWISLLRVVFLTAIVLCGQYVGGPVLAALVLSSLVIASVLSRSYGTAFGLCTGIIFSLSVVLIEFMVLVPILRFFGPTKTLFFDETWIEPFVARTTTLQHLVELNRTGAIVIALVPMFVAFVLARRFKSDEKAPLFSTVITAISFLPLVIGAVNKFRDQYSYVVSTASGDGRNNFLNAQRIRVTSDFTNFTNFKSQGDFASSLASLVSDGMGSKGLLNFDDQISLAAVYLLFGVLIAASAISASQSLAAGRGKKVFRYETNWSLGPLVVVALLSVQMPWVMNEMFRSGFFSAVVVMAICGVMLAVIVVEAPLLVRGSLLMAITVLAFATYQVAALYPLLAMALLSVPLIWKQLRKRLLLVAPVLALGVVIASQVWPGVRDQLQSRIALEGAITFLPDWVWLPSAIVGAVLLLVRGKLRAVGVVVLSISAGTSGFQFLARELRESDGLFGYGYYGVKFAYIGLFLLLLTVISATAALIIFGFAQLSRESSRQNFWRKAFITVGSATLIVACVSTMRTVAPESRSLYGNSENWINPTKDGLKISLSYWDRPKVVFAMLGGFGGGKIANFWHPYFWSGEPWNWSYFEASDDVGTICSFIDGNDVLVVTTDPVYAATVKYKCGATVEVP
jgi:hypothetical protein